MKHALLLVVLINLSACSFANSMNRVNIGMTKHEVLKTLGSPYSVSANESSEYLKYRFYSLSTDSFDEYYVRLSKGTVSSYGKMGDFDAIGVPEQKIIVDINQKIVK